MTQNINLLANYLKHGVELDLVGIHCNGSLSSDPDEQLRLAQQRNCEVDRLLPVVGELLTPDDLPIAFTQVQRDQIVSRFSLDERKQIARAALFLEITPAQIYWDESADNLLPLLKTSAPSQTLQNDCSADTTHNQKSDLATLISKRNRDLDILRGDPDTLNCFGSLLLSSQNNLSHTAAKMLASHLVAHTRINRRAERQFDLLQPLLPEESSMICASVRKNGLVPEIVLQANSIRVMTDRDFEKSVYNAQDDVLACAKENAAKGLIRGSAMTRVDRITHRDKISALKLMAEQSRSFGVFSPQVDQVSRKIFGLGEVTGLAEIALVAPEAVRRERILQRESHRDLTPVIAQAASKEPDRDAR